MIWSNQEVSRDESTIENNHAISLAHNISASDSNDFIATWIEAGLGGKIGLSGRS